MKQRLTATDLLQVGFWFRREERLFQITAWDPKDILSVTARAADTGEILQFSLTTLFASKPSTRFADTKAELMVPLGTNQTASPNVYDADTLPSSLLVRADHIIQVVEKVGEHLERIIQEYQRINKPFLLKEATRQACKLLPDPVSISSYVALENYTEPTMGIAP